MQPDQAARNAALERLDAFTGEWSIEASFPQSFPSSLESKMPPRAWAPPTGILGRTVFEWMEGGQFLVQRWEIPHPDAPDGIAIIGLDPGSEAYSQHYFDSRGVARVYAMNFSDGVWKLLRDSPDFSPLDFSQRFTGTFSDDGNTIQGRWESSGDGSSWELDFDLRYTKVK